MAARRREVREWDLGYRREDLRALAQAKLDDATLLLRNERWSNAYYLAGYAVELGLKACIAVQFVSDVIPDRQLVNDIYKHDLESLVGTAGLSAQLEENLSRDKDFATNWAIAVQWNEGSRYQSIDETSAQLLVNAIGDPTSGVLQWIKVYW